MALTLRTTTKEDEELEILKRIFQCKSSSKVISKLIANHRALMKSELYWKETAGYNEDELKRVKDSFRQYQKAKEQFEMLIK